jgi:ferredoxin
MRVEVDYALCESNGACVLEAPEIFDLDDDDNLLVLQDVPAEALRAKAEAAVRACPKRAIVIRD